MPQPDESLEQRAGIDLNLQMEREPYYLLGWKIALPGGGLAGGYELSKLSAIISAKIFWPIAGTALDIMQYGPLCYFVNYAQDHETDSSFVYLTTIVGFITFSVALCAKMILVQEEYFNKSDQYWDMKKQDRRQ
ncbi:MAG TPA: hypothetical protein VJH22_05760 [Candidatus Nanoarchaeia archaeon]|nr:hypothetical protein [Candidatus Nanoarchaeia archaeon]